MAPAQHNPAGGEARPTLGTGVNPTCAALLYMIAEADGPVGHEDLAASLNVSLRWLSSMVLQAHNLLQAVGGTIQADGARFSRRYTLQGVDASTLQRVLGPKPAKERPNHFGLTGIRDALVRALISAGDAGLDVGRVCLAMYGVDNPDFYERVRYKANEVRNVLRTQRVTATILAEQRAGRFHYTWSAGAPRMAADAPTTAPEGAAGSEVKLPANAVTLPGCGYQSWHYLPPSQGRGSKHVLRFRGEENIRVLTTADQTQRQLTTEQASAHASLADEAEDAA